ncbi:MAG TPA: SWIM zinc finger family protein [Thermomicrobiales bacterium]|nr:SWIM zinc finger family protein [Thermomicrobiales bacterium]
MARKRPAATATDASFAPLTERDVGARTDSGSFSRIYFRQGHIQDTALRGTTLQALCHGSGIVPYHVSATLALRGEEGENPRAFACTCPRGGFCKHVVALLLTWLDDPARFVTRPPRRRRPTRRWPSIASWRSR